MAKRKSRKKNRAKGLWFFILLLLLLLGLLFLRVWNSSRESGTTLTEQLLNPSETSTEIADNAASANDIVAAPDAASGNDNSNAPDLSTPAESNIQPTATPEPFVPMQVQESEEIALDNDYDFIIH